MVAALAVDASTDALKSGDIGAPLVPGVYHYGACVAAVTDEANTHNNCSASVTITVPAMYTCTSGTAKAGTPSGSVDMGACHSCNGGFKLSGPADDVGTTCVATQYTCPANGTAKDGTPTGTADEVVCATCNPGFKQVAPTGGVIGENGTTCVATVYTCPANGTAKTGSTNTNADEVVCESCNPGFKQVAPNGGTLGDDGTTCMAITYTCSNGTVTPGAPTTGNADVESCIACSSGHKLGGPGGDDCVATVYTCNNGIGKTGTPGGSVDIDSCMSCDTGYALTSTTPQLCAPDTDNDGVLNTADSCPTGVTGWSSDISTDTDSNGCRDSAIKSALEINDTSTLTGGTDAFTLTNEDNFGFSVANIGDLDGESGSGVATLAVGVRGDDTGGTNRGAVYLLNLNAAGGILGVTKIADDSTLTDGTTDAFTLTDGDLFGASVAALGDLDGSGSGVATLAVGANRDDTGGTNTGAVYLLNLNAAGGILGVTKIDDTSTLTDGTDAFTLTHVDLFGASVAALGDLDGSGSGVATLAVGANRDDTGGKDTGAVYLFNLNAAGGILGVTKIDDTSTLTDGTTEAFAISGGNNFGASVAALGDLDGSGSGVAILAVGVTGDSTGGTFRGAVYLLNLNAAGGIVGVSKLADDSTLTDGTDAFTLTNRDLFGTSVAALGDLDGSGSGVATLAVGARDDDTGGTDKGALYLLNLNAAGGILGVTKLADDSTLTDGTTDAFTLTNEDKFGTSVAALGDLDGSNSGVLTLAVGGWGDDTGGSNRGTVHVLNLEQIDWSQ